MAAAKSFNTSNGTGLIEVCLVCEVAMLVRGNKEDDQDAQIHVILTEGICN